MLIHDYIKITYTELGYLPNYPPYLISDEEMIEAFWKEDGGYFNDMYPCPCEDLEEPYNKLKEAIWLRLEAYLKAPEEVQIPAWIYQYMILRAITYGSEEEDIAYLYDLLGLNSKANLCEFTPEIARGCYRTSLEWMKKRPSQFRDRPATVFGETHVTKCLRLKQANIFIEAEGA